MFALRTIIFMIIGFVCAELGFTVTDIKFWAILLAAILLWSIGYMEGKDA